MAQPWATQYEMDVKQQRFSGPHSLGNKERELNVKLRHRVDEIMPFDDVYKLSDCDLIYRFLISKRWNLEAAERSLRKYVAFRREKQLNSILAEEAKPDVSNMGISVYGLDKDGMPLLWIDVDPAELVPLLRCSTKDDVIHEYLRVLETTRYIAKVVGVDRCGCVLSLSKISMLSVNMVLISFFREVSNLLQNMYPEIMLRLFVFDSGWAAINAWKLVKPVVDVRIQEKLRFIKGPLQAHKLNKFVTSDNVLPAFGGTGSTDYVAECAALESKRIHAQTVTGATVHIEISAHQTINTTLTHNKEEAEAAPIDPAYHHSHNTDSTPTSMICHADPTKKLVASEPDGTEDVPISSVPLALPSSTWQSCTESGALRHGDDRANDTLVETMALSNATTEHCQIDGPSYCTTVLKTVGALTQYANAVNELSTDSDSDSMSSLYSCCSLRIPSLSTTQEPSGAELCVVPGLSTDAALSLDRLTVSARDVQWRSHPRHFHSRPPSPEAQVHSQQLWRQQQPQTHRSREHDASLNDECNDTSWCMYTTCAEGNVVSGRAHTHCLRAHNLASVPPLIAEHLHTSSSHMITTTATATTTNVLVSVKSLSSSSSSSDPSTPPKEYVRTTRVLTVNTSLEDESTAYAVQDSCAGESVGAFLPAGLCSERGGGGGGATLCDKQTRHPLLLPLRFERCEDGTLLGYHADGSCVSEYAHRAMFISRAMLSILNDQQEQMRSVHQQQQVRQERQLLLQHQRNHRRQYSQSATQVDGRADSTGSHITDVADARQTCGVRHVERSCDDASYPFCESNDTPKPSPYPSSILQLVRNVYDSHMSCAKSSDACHNDENRDCEDDDSNKDNNNTCSNDKNSKSDTRYASCSDSKKHYLYMLREAKEQASPIVHTSRCDASSVCSPSSHSLRSRTKKRTDGSNVCSGSNPSPLHILSNGVAFGTLCKEPGHLMHRCVILSNSRNERFLVRSALIRRRMSVYRLDGVELERGDAKTPSRGSASRRKMAIVLTHPMNKSQNSVDACNDVSWVMYAYNRRARWMFLRRFARRIGSSFYRSDEARQQKLPRAAASAPSRADALAESSVTSTEYSGGVAGEETPLRKGQVLAEYRDGNLSLYSTAFLSSFHDLFAISLVIIHARFTSVQNIASESVPMPSLTNSTDNSLP